MPPALGSSMLKREAPDTKLEEVPVSRGEDGGSLAGGGSDSEMDTGEGVQPLALISAASPLWG